MTTNTDKRPTNAEESHVKPNDPDAHGIVYQRTITERIIYPGLMGTPVKLTVKLPWKQKSNG